MKRGRMTKLEWRMTNAGSGHEIIRQSGIRHSSLGDIDVAWGLGAILIAVASRWSSYWW
jgi:hypothetical protein